MTKNTAMNDFIRQAAGQQITDNRQPKPQGANAGAGTSQTAQPSQNELINQAIRQAAAHE
jgi:hypothetical protein